MPTIGVKAIQPPYAPALRLANYYLAIRPLFVTSALQPHLRLSTVLNAEPSEHPRNKERIRVKPSLGSD